MRFKVGEIAIVAVPLDISNLGKMVTIQEIRSRPRCEPKRPVATDYDIQMDGKVYCCADWQLRKINPPEEPASLTRTNEKEITA